MCIWDREYGGEKTFNLKISFCSGQTFKNKWLNHVSITYICSSFFFFPLGFSSKIITEDKCISTGNISLKFFFRPELFIIGNVILCLWYNICGCKKKRSLQNLHILTKGRKPSITGAKEQPLIHILSVYIYPSNPFCL